MIDEYLNLKAYTYFHCMWLFAYDYIDTSHRIARATSHILFCIYNIGCKPTTIRYH